METLSSSPDLHQGICFEYELSSLSRPHSEIRKEASAHADRYSVYLVDSEAQSVNWLQQTPTPEKKRLVMVPKPGMGKRDVYVDSGTFPVLVLADLFDTILQRLSHRVRCIVTDQIFVRQVDEHQFVKKILEVVGSSKTDEVRWLSYTDLVQGLEEAHGEALQGLGEAQEELHREDEAEEENLLQAQYSRSKAALAKCDIDKRWVNIVLEMAELSLLVSHMRTVEEPLLMSTHQLRHALLAFTRSDMKRTRKEDTAHMFGCLLFRNWQEEARGGLMKIDNIGRFDNQGTKIEEASQFFFSPGTILLEQPLHGKTATSFNFSGIIKREEILEDLEDHKAERLLLVDEEVSAKDKLLDLALDFWKQQVAIIKEKRIRKQQQNKAKRQKRN